MGTNYYTSKDYCERCERHETVHIGKSSAGWQFTFRYHGAQYYSDVPSMKKWLKNKVIRDEYGEEMTHKEFWSMVESKQGGKRNTHHKIDIDGYDFIDSEFS